MRVLLLGVFYGLIVISGWAQGGLQPKYEIPSLIAKNPEQADFIDSWTRSDGGYRLEVVAVEQGGVSVKYFNPKPINVESAEFTVFENEPLLKIILRDEGYPGSVYELSFLPERRVLIGTYVRLGQKPSQVYFVKDNK